MAIVGKQLRHRVAQLLLAAGLACAATLGQAAPVFSKMIVLGDSLSDSGNTKASLGILGGLAFIATPAGYGPNGRFSNGPVWHEVMSPLIGLPVVTPSRLGGANNNNFAHGGARIDNTSGQSAGLLNQYNSYNTKVGGVGHADPNALYTIWAGGNDMRDLVSNANPLAGVATALTGFRSILTGLIGSGATSFLIPNLPDLGMIPENRGSTRQANATNVSMLWNEGLLSILMDMHSQASFYFLDVFSTFNDLINNPSGYGFTNTTGQCRSVSGTTEVSCANANTWVFWDNIHPTAAAHAVLGRAAADLIKSGLTVPEPGTLLLVATALVLISRRGRVRVTAVTPHAMH